MDKVSRRISFSIFVVVALALMVMLFACGPSSDDKYTLTMKVEGNGSVKPDKGEHEYDFNQLVTIEALPDDGAEFIGWKVEKGITTTYLDKKTKKNINMDCDKTVTALFKKGSGGTTTGEKVTLTIVESDGGTVKANPQQEKYDKGTTVTLTATPNEGKKLKTWEITPNDPSVTDLTKTSITITMDCDRTVKAIFEDE